ncbi:hypothetical protein I5H15_gp025 [Mycobacterium phage Blexus]|uniref:Uncharacterized protein n=1 Tax=Mycobacterium phage Blexus TaxID=2656561 RepID=A0A649VHD5_9CAUD|nr:hypothetical protein I5H15_gp025 [Mycobacterium phage Blexus]QGJ91747.1 hypothetical protein SEA_BLEXUS_25 [Mycobacterium phage Blexus]
MDKPAKRWCLIGGLSGPSTDLIHAFLALNAKRIGHLAPVMMLERLSDGFGEFLLDVLALLSPVRLFLSKGADPIEVFHTR